MSEGNKKILRVGIVANTTWNIYNFRLNVVKYLYDLGHSVFVIAPVDEYISYKERFPAVRHIPLRTLQRDGKNPVKDIVLLAELYRKYKILKLDHVLHYTHKPNIFGTLAAKMAGIPNTAIVTGLGYSFINRGFVNSLTRLFYRVSAKFMDAIVFENDDDLAEFRQSGILSEGQGSAIPGCGIDLEYYQPSHNGISASDIVFTFIGRLLKDKGIREFVEAARIVKRRSPSTRFWVIGELDEGNPSTIRKDLLAEWVNEDVIEYHGFVKDVRGLLRKTNCLVLPSYREGMPRVIMEGMAMAKPIITTDVPGCRQTVDDGRTGLLVQSRDAESLGHAMLTFLGLSFDEQQRMGKAGRTKAEKLFDHQEIARQLVATIIT